MSIGKLLKLLVAEVIVAILMTCLVVVGYTWVIPRYFTGARTPSILIGGVAIGAILSGVIAKRFVNKDGSGRWLVVAVVAILVAAFIVLTTLGALTRAFGS